MRLAEAQTLVQSLETKLNMFRTMIIDGTGIHEVSDREITEKFLSLRQQAQQIAHCKAYQVDKEIVLPSNPSEEADDFYNLWRTKLSAKDLTSRLRGKVFELLNRAILGQRCFGLVEVDDQFEKLLRNFETKIEAAPNIKNDVVATWRITTLTCIDLLGVDEATSKRCAEEMSSFFLPLVEHRRRRKGQQPEDMITKLCSDAFSLRMMMRKSKGGYRCEVPGLDGTALVSELRDLVDVHAVENGRPDESSDEIAYCLFGALTKHQEHLGENKIVLEKAHVVVKSRRRV
ncbi:hypothetical protein B0J13DRAFT_447955 [Dactylonectria estremocensis]|uniref:Uncharacterized protein n=1 Tax=Dactylonectria estremocensis TaxID=1079267 RepID=A0A9P9ELW1_9HYPO|nr:hypothetical protein B0J13DRAFT_447955 [Dactylonectria estremocensis]